MKDIMNYKIDENQQQHLKLMLEIDEICKKYDIKYTLGYGTLLGAIRHEGFIPWDNDIDLNMSEKEYDKFVAACAKELDGDTRVLCDSRNYKGYPKVYGRYYDTGCSRLSDKVNFWESICGRGVDIFYQIDVPAGKEESQDFIDYFYAYDEYVNGVYRHFRMKPERVMKYYNEAKAREKEIGREATLKEMEAKIFGNEFEKPVICVDTSARYTNLNPISNIAWYDNVIRVPFEGHLLPVPGDYLEVLKNLYGDDFYMFPPEPKFIEEITHEGIPFKECRDEFMKVLDKEHLIKTRQEYKDAAVEEGYRSTRIMTNFFKAYGISIRNHILQAIEKDNIELKSLIAEPNAECQKVLDKLFDEFYTRQISESPLYWRVLFDLGSELLDAALYNLFYNRKDKKSTIKLLRLMRQNDYSFSDVMKTIDKDLECIWFFRKNIYYKKLEAAKEYYAYCIAKFSDSLEVRELALQYEFQSAPNEEAKMRCIESAAKLLEEYPDNVYAKKVLADYDYDNGRLKEAKEVYVGLFDECHDGVLLLDVKHRLAKITEV